jgi:hypothetical protein
MPYRLRQDIDFDDFILLTQPEVKIMACSGKKSGALDKKKPTSKKPTPKKPSNKNPDAMRGTIVKKGK